MFKYHKLANTYTGRVIKLMIFDLDGTLIHTLNGIYYAINSVLAKDNLQPLEMNEVKQCIGVGGTALVEYALEKNRLPTDISHIKQLQNVYLQQSLQNPTYGVSVYPGVIESLKQWLHMGISLAVCTNKCTALTTLVLEKLRLTQYFDHIVTGDMLFSRKPDPCQINHLIDISKVERDAVIMVGDSKLDLQAAQAAEITPILVTYGYGQIDPNQYSDVFRINQFMSITDLF